MASEKILGILEEVKALTVLELSELVKSIEEEFGVSAAAADVVAALLPVLLSKRRLSSTLS